ncbi:signal peptidase II [Desulfurobacterium indicum]|uniref:Lipoprotein signal peptidase n=1 Tax=Desulfurobacterium indicum TaxID=1914305 RepID=A0A1R1MLP0_9BACT|nr:signal peptidase II [Desulfurobacterium indicum]OMH40614.1 signal peptidase II [Desulfurobacterium indicum]
MIPFLVAFFVFAIDRITKMVAFKYLKGKVIAVIPGFFNLVLAQNRGAAFSIFSSTSGWGRFIMLIGFPIVIVIFIMYLLLTKREYSLYLKIALALILGGALGNLYDRIVYGTVVDFLDFYFGKYHWPTFNVADIAVFLGTVMLILNVSREKKAEA